MSATCCCAVTPACPNTATRCFRTFTPFGSLPPTSLPSPCQNGLEMPRTADVWRSVARNPRALCVAGHIGCGGEHPSSGEGALPPRGAAGCPREQTGILLPPTKLRTAAPLPSPFPQGPAQRTLTNRQVTQTTWLGDTCCATRCPAGLHGARPRAGAQTLGCFLANLRRRQCSGRPTAGTQNLENAQSAMENSVMDRKDAKNCISHCLPLLRGPPHHLLPHLQTCVQNDQCDVRRGVILTQAPPTPPASTRTLRKPPPPANRKEMRRCRGHGFRLRTPHGDLECDVWAEKMFWC